MNIHFVQHESFEAPGAYLNWAEHRKQRVTFSKVFANEPLPQSVHGIDLLIVMGGPQSPDTTLDKCPYFYANAEKNLINQCIAAGKKVIGVCLGAQLIGEALGAQYEHGSEPEIGNFPIELTEEGMEDIFINQLGKTLIVSHWHNDMPGLTPESKILAKSGICPRQIIRFADNVYGFQCHMEMTAGTASALIANEKALDAMHSKYLFVQSRNEIMEFNYEEMNKKLYQFLDAFSKSRS